MKKLKIPAGVTVKLEHYSDGIQITVKRSIVASFLWQQRHDPASLEDRIKDCVNAVMGSEADPETQS